VDRRSWILFSIVSAVWGASYLFIKVALEDLSPAMVVFARVVLGAAVLLPFALRSDALHPLRDRLGLVVMLAAVQIAGPFLLISAGEQEISSSLAGILVATAPIFTALLAVRIDHEERVRGWSLAGVAIGIVGVVLLLGVDVGGDEAALLGALMVVVAALGYAISGFVLKRRFADVPPVGSVTAALIASSVLSLPAAAATAPDSAPQLDTVLSILGLGAGGTGLAFACYYILNARVGPTKASLVAYVSPGFAVAYGVVLLDERVTWGTFAGLALVLLGSWLAAEGRLPRRAAAAAEPAAVGAARGTG
jgi:drug/metabolite transporter (DMT)-like permease